MEGDAIVRQLGRLGLTSYEAKAYFALSAWTIPWPAAAGRRSWVVEHPQLAGVLKIAFEAVFDSGLTFDQAYRQLVVKRAKTA